MIDTHYVKIFYIMVIELYEVIQESSRLVVWLDRPNEHINLFRLSMSIY